MRNQTTLYLIEDISDAIEKAQLIDPEIGARIAEIVLERLQERHGGRRMYVPAKSKNKAIAALKKAYTDHEPVRSICKRERISRRTLYRILRAEE